MRITDSTRIAFREILRNRLRSLLTALGIVIGVATFVVLVSLGRGATARLQQEVAKLGRNVILVDDGSYERKGVRLGKGSASALSAGDALAIASRVHGVAAVSPETYSSEQVTTRGRNWKTKIRGEGADYFGIRRWAPAQGELFSEADVQAGRLVAVMGQTAVRELFESDSPIGETIRVRNVPMVVVGVLEPKGTSLKGSDEDDVIFVPYTTATQRLLGGKIGLHRINVQAAEGASLARVGRDISALLCRRHRVPPEAEDGAFDVETQVEIEDVATGTSRTMTVLLAALSGVALLVGGVGIMNIMLVSVTERTREIGVRMAVGAPPAEVMRQFLVESLWLGTAGGLIGAVVGVSASRAMARAAGWPVSVSSGSILVALLFSAGIGVFFGFFPARKAARLDPIEALRHE